MTQYARPASDISAGNWTDEGAVDNDGNLYTSVDEATHDGDDSYLLNNTGGGDYCEVKLGPVTDPASSVGHIVHCYFRSIGSGAGEKLDVALYQGATFIDDTQNEANRSGTYNDATFTLDAADADSIDDYTDLRIRLYADTVGGEEELRVTQCYLEVPDAAGDPEISEAESIDGSDTATVSRQDAITRTSSEAEAITVSDSPLLAMAALIVSRAESVTVSDDPTVSAGAEPDRDISESEAVTVSDSALVSMAVLAASRTEGITVADVVLAVMEALWAQRAESITTSDDPTVAVQGMTLGIAITEGEDYYTPKPIIVG